MSSFVFTYVKPAKTIAMSEREKENLIAQTVNLYTDRLMAFIRPKVRNEEDAEDILQEVWFQFSNLTNVSHIVHIGSWLYKVTRNKITDGYRKKKTTNLDDYVAQGGFEDFSIKDLLLLDDKKNPELKFFQDEIWNELYKALNELPEKQRRAYIENEIEDKTLQQIADEQGENLKTIISRKRYAVKHLRHKLQQLYNDLNSL